MGGFSRFTVPLDWFSWAPFKGESKVTFRKLKAVRVWLQVQLCTKLGQKAFQPNSICFFFLSNSCRKDLFKTASTALEDEDSLTVFCLIFLSLDSHLSWKICGRNIIKRNESIYPDTGSVLISCLGYSNGLIGVEEKRGES